MGAWNLPTEPDADWLMDPSRPEKLKFSQLLNASDGADATPFKVNGMHGRTHTVGKRRAPPPGRRSEARTPFPGLRCPPFQQLINGHPSVTTIWLNEAHRAIEISLSMA